MIHVNPNKITNVKARASILKENSLDVQESSLVVVVFFLREEKTTSEGSTMMVACDTRTVQSRNVDESQSTRQSPILYDFFCCSEEEIKFNAPANFHVDF